MPGLDGNPHNTIDPAGSLDGSMPDLGNTHALSTGNDLMKLAAKKCVSGIHDWSRGLHGDELGTEDPDDEIDMEDGTDIGVDLIRIDLFPKDGNADKVHCETHDNY